MTDRNLTVARLVTEHIDGITVEGSAFADLLDSLGIAEKIEQRYSALHVGRVIDKSSKRTREVIFW